MSPIGPLSMVFGMKTTSRIMETAVVSCLNTRCEMRAYSCFSKNTGEQGPRTASHHFYLARRPRWRRSDRILRCVGSRNSNGLGFGMSLPLHQVFFSSAAQIGRLIDNLSHGAEAGSFNIMPTANGTPSHPDPAHWTVEERLEHMLTSLGTS